jgi:flagellar biosynthesis protein FlgN
MTDLVELLNQQDTNLATLKEIILQEKDALVQQNADLLLSLASQKSQCLIMLKQNDQLLANHPDKPLLSSVAELQTRIGAAKQELSECQRLNQENASLIELQIASLNRFAQALQLSRNASSLTYNEKGKTSTISTLGNDLKA